MPRRQLKGRNRPSSRKRAARMAEMTKKKFARCARRIQAGGKGPLHPIEHGEKQKRERNNIQ